MLAGAVDPADCFSTTQCINPPKVSQRTVRGAASLFDLFSPHSTVLRPESGVASPGARRKQILGAESGKAPSLLAGTVPTDAFDRSLVP